MVVTNPQGIDDVGPKQLSWKKILTLYVTIKSQISLTIYSYFILIFFSFQNAMLICKISLLYFLSNLSQWIMHPITTHLSCNYMVASKYVVASLLVPSLVHVSSREFL